MQVFHETLLTLTFQQHIQNPLCPSGKVIGKKTSKVFQETIFTLTLSTVSLISF